LAPELELLGLSRDPCEAPWMALHQKERGKRIGEEKRKRKERGERTKKEKGREKEKGKEGKKKEIYD